MKLIIEEISNANLDEYIIDLDFDCDCEIHKLSELALATNESFTVSKDYFVVNGKWTKDKKDEFMDNICEPLNSTLISIMKKLIRNPLHIQEYHYSNENGNAKDNSISYSYYFTIGIDLDYYTSIAKLLPIKLYNTFSNFVMRFSNHIKFNKKNGLFKKDNIVLSSIEIDGASFDTVVEYVIQIINSRLKIVDVINALPEVCTEEEITNLAINTMPTNTSYTYKEFLDDFYNNKVKPKR